MTTQTEMKRRTDLVNCSTFRTMCAEAAPGLGFSVNEWNKHKTMILLMMANEMIKRQDSETN